MVAVSKQYGVHVIMITLVCLANNYSFQLNVNEWTEQMCDNNGDNVRTLTSNVHVELLIILKKQ